MRSLAAALAAVTVSSGAMAQSYYGDMACRQYASDQVGAIQAQANSQAFGDALVGAGLGAAFGAAIGGGRGAGIGAASGAILGTGMGAANAQNAAMYAQQQYNAYYAQCMSAQAAPPPPAYAPAYAPAYTAAPAAPQPSRANDLNRQELNRVQSPPQYYYPPQRF